MVALLTAVHHLLRKFDHNSAPADSGTLHTGEECTQPAATRRRRRLSRSLQLEIDWGTRVRVPGRLQNHCPSRVEKLFRQIRCWPRDGCTRSGSDVFQIHPARLYDHRPGNFRLRRWICGDLFSHFKTIPQMTTFLILFRLAGEKARDPTYTSLFHVKLHSGQSTIWCAC